MKPQLKKLTDLIAKADANVSELQRHKEMLEAAKAKREKLIASGAVEDVKIRTAISDCDLDCRMLPHRIAQYEQHGAELEKLIVIAGNEVSCAVHDESIRVEALLNSRGLARVVAQLKPLGYPNNEALQTAAALALGQFDWLGKLQAAQQGVRGVPARATIGYAEEILPVIAAVEKFCA